MSDVWLSIVMVVVFVLIGGVFSGAEIALVSLRESQVRGMAESGRRGQAVQRLLSDPNRFLAAVQVGVTLAGFFSAAFGASTLSEPLARWLETRGLSEGLSGTLALILVTDRDQLPVAGRRRAHAQAARAAARRGVRPHRRRSAERDRQALPAGDLAPVGVDQRAGAPRSAATRSRAASRSARRNCATWWPRTSPSAATSAG